MLGVDNDEAICLLSDPSLSSLNQDVAKGGYDTAARIEKFVKDRNYKCLDIIVEPTYITMRESTNIFSSNDPYISTVLKYIHQNIHQKISVRKLVELVPLSRRLLEIHFRDATGESVYSYILKLRIEQFAIQLIETDKPIINIALELGYSDYKNISRLFKKVKGCTPSEYRAAI